jgi:hypothetical protein
LVDEESESVRPVVVNDGTTEDAPPVVEPVSEKVSENNDEEGMFNVNSLEDN